jgi:hypothetical protein
MFRKRVEKSTLPSARPIGGMMISATSEVTILPNATPIMMPTALSRTFPRIAKALNSFSILPLGRNTGRGFSCPTVHEISGIRRGWQE